MGGNISRRDFARRSVLATGSVLLGAEAYAGGHDQMLDRGMGVRPFQLMNDVARYRKIDAYANVLLNAKQAEAQIRFADRLNIEKLVVAVPIARTMGGTSKDIRVYNESVVRAVTAFPDRLLGQFTVNPLDRVTAGNEIKRGVDAGMTGIKLFNHVKLNHPSVFPVIEALIDHKMLIHVHGESQIGVGGYRMKYDVKNNPAISVPEDFTDVARRYPEAMFQYAHIGGGSDWEYACKCFVNYPNIYVDTGGSNNEENMIDFAVSQLGEDRVFFGCDSSFYQGIGKILSAGITEVQKQKVFFDNYNNVLKKSGRGLK